jgi:hypothetical protein
MQKKLFLVSSLLLFTFLLAPSVWADGVPTCGDAVTPYPYPCASKKQIEVTCVAGCTRTDCEIKMEAAMRAMEPFMIEGYWPRDPNAYAHTEEGVRAKFTANQLWVDIKRTCWRQP